METRINTIGNEFLKTLNPTKTLENLNKEQISYILSLQNTISFSESGRWKVSGKKKQGGHLNLKKFHKIFE